MQLECPSVHSRITMTLMRKWVRLSDTRQNSSNPDTALNNNVVITDADGTNWHNEVNASKNTKFHFTHEINKGLNFNSDELIRISPALIETLCQVSFTHKGRSKIHTNDSDRSSNNVDFTTRAWRKHETS